MPHNFNEDRRHKIPRQKFQVTNWPAYNESLRRRGDLTVWISDDALPQWAAPRRTSRGGRPKYSDMAITMCLTLRVVYDQPLRQTQGMMRSIVKLKGVEISVPDFSTLAQCQRFASSHGLISNLFLVHRKHQSAAEHRTLRIEAMAVWREITLPKST